MRLQKAPLALLGAFDIKSEGRNPDEFSNTVTPVVDVYDQYLADQLIRVSTQVTIAGGTVNTLTGSPLVPNGLTYRLIAIGASLVLIGADSGLTGAAAFGLAPPGSPFSPTFVFADTFVGAPLVRYVGFKLPGPIILQSGWAMPVTLNLSAVPANNAVMAASFLVQAIPN